jgi:erythromycin esterase
MHRRSFPLFEKTLSTITSIHTQGTGKEDIKWNIFYNSSIAFLPGFVRRTNSLSPYHDPKINVNELRDSVMALNLVDIASRLYPGKKIIVWAATDHISRNYRKNMGYFLEKYSTERVYTIGFTAATGTIWNFVDRKIEALKPIKPNSFEDLFSRTGIQNLFLDFKANAQTKKGKWLSDLRTMRPIGYVDVNKDWTKNFDAVIFNSKMEPSHFVR